MKLRKTDPWKPASDYSRELSRANSKSIGK